MKYCVRRPDTEACSSYSYHFTSYMS